MDLHNSHALTPDTPSQKPLIRDIVITGAIVGTVMIYVFLLANSRVRLSHLGVIANFFTICFFASPLSTMVSCTPSLIPSLLAHPHYLHTLTTGTPSLLAHPHYWHTLTTVTPSLLAHPHYWHTLTTCTPSLLAHPHYWHTLTTVTPSLLAHPHYWHTLTTGTPSLLSHPHYWHTLTTGTPSRPSQATVIHAQSTESMSLPFSVLSSLVTSLWTLYGVAISDIFVQVCHN